MDAKELMIGDWVLWKNKPVQVASVSGVEYSFGQIDVILAHCNDEKLLEKHDIKSIQPIPLTSEILEKNGFVKVFRGRYRFEDNRSIVEISTSNGEMKWVRVSKYDENFSTTIINCLFANMRYVHEFQHILRLCEIEIII